MFAVGVGFVSIAVFGKSASRFYRSVNAGSAFNHGPMVLG
jgi:DnaJ family protein C protein 19